MTKPTPDRPAVPGGISTRNLLTVAKTAELLSVSIKQVRRLIERNDLPHVRIGRRVLVHPDDLEAFIARHRHTRPLTSTHDQ
ncbi:MAG: helix-turn-helix domain-containing protein [Gammaproteobacteria bacterium]